MLHAAEECRRFVTNVILKECAVTVAEDDSGIGSFLALRREEVRLLYTRLTALSAKRESCSSRRRNRAGSKSSNYGAFKPVLGRVASMKREVFARSALPMERTTRKRHPTFATGVNLPQVADRSSPPASNPPLG